MMKHIADPNLTDLNQASERIVPTDCIFIARQFQEKRKEQNCHLYALFFDLANREAL